MRKSYTNQLNLPLHHCHCLSQITKLPPLSCPLLSHRGKKAEQCILIEGLAIAWFTFTSSWERKERIMLGTLPPWLPQYMGRANKKPTRNRWKISVCGISYLLQFIWFPDIILACIKEKPWESKCGGWEKTEISKKNIILRVLRSTVLAEPCMKPTVLYF